MHCSFNSYHLSFTIDNIALHLKFLTDTSQILHIYQIILKLRNSGSLPVPTLIPTHRHIFIQFLTGQKPILKRSQLPPQFMPLRQNLNNQCNNQHPT